MKGRVIMDKNTAESLYASESGNPDNTDAKELFKKGVSFYRAGDIEALEEFKA